MKIEETWHNLHSPAGICCLVRILEGHDDNPVARGEGSGSTCEIARANAYRELVGDLIERKKISP